LGEESLAVPFAPLEVAGIGTLIVVDSLAIAMGCVVYPLTLVVEAISAMVDAEPMSLTFSEHTSVYTTVCHRVCSFSLELTAIRHPPLKHVSVLELDCLPVTIRHAVR